MAISGLRSVAGTINIERGASLDGKGEWSRIEGCDAVTLYVCVRPAGEGDAEYQFSEIYRQLGSLLGEQGASRRHVITEKVYLADVAGDAEQFRTIRETYYTAGNGHGSSLPATTFVQQPPATPGVLGELQCLVMVPLADEPLNVRDLTGLPAPAAGKVVSARGYDHIFMQNITGGHFGDGMDYAGQAEDMFHIAERVLKQEHLTFRDVIRTWIYLDEMERDYATLNRVRSEFFQQNQVERVPASTGIQGGVYPPDRGGLLDLYALRTDREVDIRVMHAPTLNEAWSYGSAFSRGMAVQREDRVMLYVSGTASIDTSGQVVHVGDTARQVERMLLNITELLAGSDATPENIIRATTYLKDGADFDTFRHVYAEHGYPLDVPHTICEAAVCRPDWLVETEVTAVVSVA